MRFQHILVPTDLTERTDGALRMAASLIVSPHGRITLVHVTGLFGDFGAEDLTPLYERMRIRARAAMTAITLRAAVDATAVDTAVVSGRVAEEIVRFATSNAVDLIVLSSHRVNPSMVDRDWGTISYKVGILAQCPVLLVK